MGGQEHKQPAGGGSGGTPAPKFSISKISVNPSRKINLGNYNSAELNAGIEIVFDTPVLPNSPELKEAFEEARRIVKAEFQEQYKPYHRMLKKGEK